MAPVLNAPRSGQANFPSLATLQREVVSAFARRKEHPTWWLCWTDVFFENGFCPVTNRCLAEGVSCPGWMSFPLISASLGISSVFFLQIAVFRVSNEATVWRPMFISTWLELFLLQLSEPIKLVIRFCNCCCNYSLGTSKGIIKYGDSKDYFFPAKSSLLNFCWPGLDFSH